MGRKKIVISKDCSVTDIRMFFKLYTKVFKSMQQIRALFFKYEYFCHCILLSTFIKKNSIQFNLWLFLS